MRGAVEKDKFDDGGELDALRAFRIRFRGVACGAEGAMRGGGASAPRRGDRW